MERARKSNAAVLLALLAAAFAVAAIWAATALAGGGSSSASGDPGSSQPAVEFAQSQEEPAPSADDCPDHQDGSGGGSGGDSEAAPVPAARPVRTDRARRTSDRREERNAGGGHGARPGVRARQARGHAGMLGHGCPRQALPLRGPRAGGRPWESAGEAWPGLDVSMWLLLDSGAVCVSSRRPTDVSSVVASVVRAGHCGLEERCCPGRARVQCDRRGALRACGRQVAATAGAERGRRADRSARPLGRAARDGRGQGDHRAPGDSAAGGAGAGGAPRGRAAEGDRPLRAVEIQPSEIGAEGAERQAKLLETFDRLLELPEAVVFVDEVEDIASMRHEERRVSPNITNEFLKQIPRLREARHHLLVCATNSVGMLDPAFLRPGRFDYVLPVGPPNDEARAAIWSTVRRTRSPTEPVDVSGPRRGRARSSRPRTSRVGRPEGRAARLRARALRGRGLARDDRRLPRRNRRDAGDADAGDGRGVRRRHDPLLPRVETRRCSEATACVTPASPRSG